MDSVCEIQEDTTWLLWATH